MVASAVVSLALSAVVTAQQPSPGAPVDPDVYAPQVQSTEQGCECSSPCSTSHEVFCYSQLVCEVKSFFCARGHASAWPGSGKGFFDFCTFAAYAPYESQTAEAKEALLWSKVRAEPQAGYDYIWPNVTEMFHSDLHVSTQAVSDVFPIPHKKYMHAWGAVAPVRFESSGDHPYTGLFRGAEHGLIRLGMTLPSRSQDGVWFDGVIAGAAVKLFRDGHPSGNFFAIPTTLQQACGSNFFEQVFSTHILNGTAGEASPFTGFAGEKLPQVTLCPVAVGTSHLAMEADAYSDEDVFPFKVEISTSCHSAAIDCNDHPTSLARFAALGGDGTEIFQVWATAEPGAERRQIGRLVLKANLTLSKFGDEQLFFKHQAVEEDFARRPEWLEVVDKEDMCGLSVKIGPVEIAVGTKIPKRSEGCLLCGLSNIHKDLCSEHSLGEMLDSDAGVFV